MIIVRIGVGVPALVGLPGLVPVMASPGGPERGNDAIVATCSAADRGLCPARSQATFAPLIKPGLMVAG